MSAEVGIEIGALWMVAVTLVRMVFERGTSVRDSDYKKYYGGKDESTDVGMWFSMAFSNNYRCFCRRSHAQVSIPLVD